MDKKTLRNDFILVVSLLVAATVALVVILTRPKIAPKEARVYVQNTLVETIDLSIDDEADFYIDGLKGKVHIKRVSHQVGIVESSCPHKDCINMGFTSDPNRPIICAYNAVSIIVSGSTVNDVVIG